MTTITPLYQAKIPRTDAPAGGYLTAEQELAAALEGQAPALAREVAGLIGPGRTVNLARAISRAVAVGIRRRGEQATAELVAGAYDLLVDGLNQITECTTSEDENG